MTEISNRSAPINAPAIQSAGGISRPTGLPLAPSQHPALKGALGQARVATIGHLAGVAATPVRAVR
jgi:hypothetical protein